MIDDMEIKEKYKEAIDEFVRRALEKYGDKIDSIILFGSVARGEANEDSDYRYFSGCSWGQFKMRRELSGIVLDVLLETGKYISVKTLSIEDIKFLREVKSSFLSNVIKEGVYIERGKVIA